MAQSPEALTKVLGSQSSVVSLLLQARAVAIESLAGDIRGIAIDPFDRRLRQYLIMSMGSLSDERLRILFLDGARHLIADEVVQSGSLAQLSIFPRTIFRRALELNAAGLILVHNHPSGNHNPSTEDIEATQKLQIIGRSLNVEIIDHIVVTSTHCHHVVSDDTLAGRPVPSASFTLRSPEGPARTDHGDIALANAKAAMRRRLLRQQLIGAPELFGDPAWEMLIDLFVHECERKRLSISALCVTSSIPMSSALRLAQRLCDAGITRRVPDPIDGRRTFIRLDPVIAHRIRAYFEAGAE
ncbi:JAB domain-containing protein [uncultured Sphingopyxis sp.]|jgi:DNA repair protein RadC|uniref:JAB domain-containing protein n=1 Tax=uncultured Sphingopyxis sp. TaxID=310581 RepID=UPI000A4A61E9|nr:JAB domain-containing protein [uncultured Sphingopyxis sp.]